ncbi:MAG: glycosyltransferase family 4 protein [Microthrixaceae bacterium]
MAEVDPTPAAPPGRAPAPDAADPRPGTRLPRVAMVLSRFPKVTETYQLREITALERLGMSIELYAITHHDDGGPVQRDAVALDRRANYFGRISLEIIRAQLTWLRRNPSAYWGAWRWSLVTNRGAPDFLVRSFLLVPLAAAMALRMERDGIEHVHAHFATYPTHVALVVKMLTGLPYSFTGHAHDIQHRQDGLGDKIREAEFFFCCTEYGREQLRRLYGSVVEEKCVVVHHGVELDRYTMTPLPDDDGERAFRILCVATFEECKGHQYLIEATSRLVDRGVEVEVALVGGDPPRRSRHREDMIRLAAELGLGDRVRFVGKVAAEEVRRWIEWSDIGVLAACATAKGDKDGLPNVLTESLAMGRPVVSTTQEGTMELVVDGVNGLLVRTRDASALADAIERMRRDPAMRERMATAGRGIVERDHDVVANTRTLAGEYLRRVGRPAPDDSA